MASSRCRLMEAQDKRDLIEINTLIDLTDKPIGLNRDEIGWSRVRSNASNCICCCNNNSITLVTTNDSYTLDHIPLDNIQFAQTNASLQYLALSNHRKIVIIDLADHQDTEIDDGDLGANKCDCKAEKTSTSTTANSDGSISSSGSIMSKLTSETKVINIGAYGLTMNDILFWRWIDDFQIAILSYEALYTCSLNQQHINHPAYTAFSTRSRYLSMEKVFDSHQYLSALCQVNNIQQDKSGNIFAISSLYSASSLMMKNHYQTPPTSVNTQLNSNDINQTANNHINNNIKQTTLKPSFGSMPSRLSQLANNDQSFDSLNSDILFNRSLVTSPTNSHNLNSQDDEVCGLIQVHCRLRNRSQLIQAHAISFTNSTPPNCHMPVETSEPTILVAANKIGSQMRVHFIEMPTTNNCLLSNSGKSSCPTIKFNRLCDVDFPTYIVCSHVSNDNEATNYLHIAFITTKFGQLFICSVAHSTILFNTSITADVISSTVLEDKTQGLMVICRNGQVLLAKLRLAKLMKLLDESKTLRHISSSHNISLSSSNNNNNIDNNYKSNCTDSNNNGLEIIISTKL